MVILATSIACCKSWLQTFLRVPVLRFWYIVLKQGSWQPFNPLQTKILLMSLFSFRYYIYYRTLWSYSPKLLSGTPGLRDRWLNRP